MFFGSAVSNSFLHDELYLALFSKYCSWVTPEWELKWGAIEKKFGSRDFSAADKFVQFFRSRGYKIRGHTLIWHQNMGGWVKSVLNTDNVIRIVEDYVVDVVSRYKGSVEHWDVVNEAIKTSDKNEIGLRGSVFQSLSGINYIEAAFRSAHSVDPRAKLFYNDYGFYRGKGVLEKRKALLQLIDYLLSRDVPVHGIGLQSHLKIDGDYEAESSYGKFVSDLSSFGLEIVVSELDVDDSKISKTHTVPERDFMVACSVKKFLDVITQYSKVSGILTWGLSDRYSNLNRNIVGDLNSRPLPFDDFLQPKEFWYVLRSFLR